MADAKFLQLFLQEAEDLLDRLEDALLNLEKDPKAADHIASAFRAIHTLKGSGAMTGFDSLVEVAHEVESVFDLVRNGEMQVSSQLISLTLSAKDHLRQEIEGTADPAVRAQLISAIKAVAAAPPTPTTEEVLPDGEPRLHRLMLNFDAGVLEAGSNLPAIFDDLRELGTLDLTLRRDTIVTLDQLQPTKLSFQWQADLTTSASEADIRNIFLFLADDSGIEVHTQAPIAEASELAKPAAKNTSPADTIKVQVTKLDDLVDLVGELVIAKSRLSAISGSLDDPELVAVAEDMERLSNDLRDRIMDLRMLPMSATFRRFERLVRDLALELNKSLRLDTQGGDTELDKTVLDRLGDPLVHLIRNAADHGIEAPEDRLRAGKDKVGTIALRARQTESRVMIQIEDDGRGIDDQRVRAKAIERSLLSPDDDLSREQLLEFIFEPGFSTAKTVSSVSGRGVGMDAVRRSIGDLNGTLTLDSQKGAGTRFTVELPLSLAIMDGLLVRVGDDPFLFPLSLVEECIEPPSHNDGAAENRLIQVRNELVPYVSLREWFRLPTERNRDAQVVVTNLGQGRFGFLVDSVVGQHQTVLKDLGPVGRNVQGLSGATILGDGTVALILDASQIIQGMEAEGER